MIPLLLNPLTVIERRHASEIVALGYFFALLWTEILAQLSKINPLALFLLHVERVVAVYEESDACWHGLCLLRGVSLRQPLLQVVNLGRDVFLGLFPVGFS